MLDKFWISEDGWGKIRGDKELPEGVKEVSEEEYLNHEQVVTSVTLEEFLKENAPKAPAKKKPAAKKKASTGRKKVAAPKKEDVDGS